MFNKRTYVILIFFVALLILSSRILASTIFSGDLFLSSSGGFYNVPGGSLVDFSGSPFVDGPGNADTHLLVLEDVELPGVGSTAIINTQLIRLEAASIAPISIGGELFDFFISLTPDTISLGFIEIMVSSPTDNGSAPAGSYTNHFEINFTVDFTPISEGVSAFSITDSIFIESVNPGLWSLDPIEAGSCNTTNFFQLGEMPMLDVASGNGGIHSPCKFNIPEPSPLVLIFLGVIVYLLLRVRISTVG